MGSSLTVFYHKMLPIDEVLGLYDDRTLEDHGETKNEFEIRSEAPRAA